jgi:hypothetical protein
MRILFDHSTPAPLRHYLKRHLVTEAVERGWDELENGVLLTEAAAAGFDVFVTADKNIRYQQNLTGRTIAIVELSTPRCPVVRNYIEPVAAAVDSATPDSYSKVDIPLPPKEPFLRS